MGVWINVDLRGSLGHGTLCEHKRQFLGNSAFPAYLVGTLLLPCFLVLPSALVQPGGYLTLILRFNNTERDIKAINKCTG